MEHQARLAIQAYLIANEATFFDDLFVNGDQQREWKHVTVSGVTPPTAYPYASIFVEGAPVSESSLGQNVSISIPSVTYDVSVVIIDYMEGVAGETELYETMDIQFQTFTDRIKLGIFNTGSFIYDDVRFSLPKSQRTVDKSNTLVRWPEAENYWAVLATQITFQLEECIAS